MVTAQSLKAQFEDKAAQIEAAVANVSEDQAQKKPGEGEWCARDVLYHLGGDVDQTFVDGINRILNEDKPLLPVAPGELYPSPEREQANVQDLATMVADQYRQLGDFVSGLDAEQMSRIGRIGFLKEARGNDEIALAEWIALIVNYHMGLHIEQLRACLK